LVDDFRLLIFFLFLLFLLHLWSSSLIP
jgi:hypothetical protein